MSSVGREVFIIDKKKALSASLLSQYAFCPRAAWYRFHKVPPPVSEGRRLARGRFWHRFFSFRVFLGALWSRLWRFLLFLGLGAAAAWWLWLR